MVFSNNLLLGAVSAAAGDYLIEQSLLFNDNDSAYLSRIPSVTGNRKTWTWSGWMKRANIDAYQHFICAGPSGSDFFVSRFGTTGKLELWDYSSATDHLKYITTAVFNDSSAWYHIVFAVDTTQATASNRVKIYVNGVQVTAFDTETDPSLNFDTHINSSSYKHEIGALTGSGANVYTDGLMAFPILVDGAALDATSFGEEDDDGYWNPIEFAGSATLDLIPFGDGTIIGNATGLSGQAAAFNGVIAQTGANSAQGTTDPTYIGKQWSSAKTIRQAIIYSPTDDNFGGGSPVTVTLEGSTDNFSSSIVTLGTVSGIVNTGVAKVVTFNEADLITTTAYEYHRFKITGGGSGSKIAEAQFFAESATSGYGTNGFVLDFADSSHFGNDVSGAGVTPDLTVATSWSGTNLAQYGFSAGNITKNTLSQNAIRTVGVWGGDFSITLDLLDGDGTFGTNEQFFGFASASDTFDDTKTASTITGTNYYIQPATDSATLMTYYRNGAALSTFAVVPGDTIKWERSGTTVTLYVNTVSRFSETTSLTGLVYGFIQLYKTNESADNVTTTGTFSNSFIDNGFVSTDQLADTPTDSADEGIGNRLVFNANNKGSSSTLSEANTKITGTGATWAGCYTSIMIPTTGVWYVAAKYAGTYDGGNAGVLALSTSGADITTANYDYSGSYAAVAGGGVSGEIRYSGANQASVSMTTNDEIGFLVDRDTDVVKVYKNGILVHTYSQLPGTTELWASGWVYGSSGSINLINDQTNLVSGAPSGSLDIATQNLPAPTIADGSDYFNTVLYTGDGSTQAITGVGFQPDLVWIKARETVTSNGNHGVWDAVRGTSAALRTNTTEAELGYGVTAFGADGFTVPSNTEVNENTKDYVAWCWKANGAGSSNTDGSITATVSANQTAGFSIVTYTGTGVAATVGHGLGVAPKMIFAKERDGVNAWNVYHASIGATQRGYLNTDAVFDATAAPWNNTAPTTSVFTVGTADVTNRSAGSILAYCWAEVEGFSKFGSYTGNGSTDGPFVYTGFRPAFILWKPTSATGNWNITDSARSTYNITAANLNPNTTNVEGTAAIWDFVSNGVKIRNSNTYVNGSGTTYIYAAFAEHPFQGDEGYTQARAR
jgi:hypothetical protein